MVGTVVATDADTKAGALTYAITSGNTGNHFKFSGTNQGEILVDTALGAGAATYTLNVRVTDGGTPSHNDTAAVTITVLDVAP